MHYADHGGIIGILFQQFYWMIAQKNRKDAAITDTYLPEWMVDFELLWRYISKIPKTSQVATYTKDFSNFNNKIVYKNSKVQSAMYIFVSMPLGFITGGLLGSPWGTFWFLQVGWEFAVYNVDSFPPGKIQNSQISQCNNILHTK